MLLMPGDGIVPDSSLLLSAMMKRLRQIWRLPKSPLKRPCQHLKRLMWQRKKLLMTRQRKHHLLNQKLFLILRQNLHQLNQRLLRPRLNQPKNLRHLWRLPKPKAKNCTHFTRQRLHQRPRKGALAGGTALVPDH